MGQQAVDLAVGWQPGTERLPDGAAIAAGKDPLPGGRQHRAARSGQRQELGDPATAQRTFQRLPGGAGIGAPVSAGGCVQQGEPARRCGQGSRPAARRNPPCGDLAPRAAAVGAATHRQCICTRIARLTDQQGGIGRIEAEGQLIRAGAGLRRAHRLDGRRPGLTGIVADQQVAAVGGDEEPLGARRVRDQVRQEVARPLLETQRGKSCPRPAVVAAAVDCAIGLLAGHGRAQEEGIASIAGDPADEDIFRPGRGLAQRHSLPMLASIRAAPEAGVSGRCVTGALQPDVKVAGSGIEVERGDRPRREVIRDRLPGGASVSAAVKRVRPRGVSRIIPLCLIIAAVHAGHTDGVQLDAVRCSRQMGDAAARPPQRLPVRGDLLRVGGRGADQPG